MYPKLGQMETHQNSSHYAQPKIKRKTRSFVISHAQQVWRMHVLYTDDYNFEYQQGVNLNFVLSPFKFTSEKFCMWGLLDWLYQTHQLNRTRF